MPTAVYNYANIPDVLQALPQWVNWQLVKRGDKLTKVPYCSRDGSPADTTKASTWSTFTEACEAYEDPESAYSGIGFVFAADGGIFGFDADHMRDRATGAIHPDARVILDGFDTYTEVSPSGTGIHAIGFGALPGAGKKRAPFEVYDRSRFFTMTGIRVDDYPATLSQVNGALTTFYESLAGAIADAPPRANRAGITELSDDDLIDKAKTAKNGAKFGALWDGSTAAYNDDDSSAAMGLCNLLAWWTNSSAEQMDRLFRRSGLMRPKWDERRGRSTWGWNTIREAIRIVRGGYSAGAPEIEYVESNGHTVNPETGEVIEDDTPVATRPLLVDEPIPFIPLKDLREYVLHEEYGDAHLLKRLFKGRLVYDHGAANWHFWGGNAWREDRTKQVYHLIGGMLASVYLRGVAEAKKKITLLEAAESEDEAAKEANKKELEQLKKLVGDCVERSKGLRTRKRMNNVLAVAQAFLSVTGEEWDTQPTLLAVANGVVDITTGDLEPGRPRDYLRATAPTEWTGLDTPAPAWVKFLAEMFMGRPEMPPFLQRLCGLGIRGDVPEHRLPILHGARGRNGKDVLLGTLHTVLGSAIASAIEEDALIGRKRTGGANPSVMDLQGKRIVWISETSERASLNAGQVKLITGGGDITARQLYGKNVTFRPSHLIWLITNFLPQGSHDDDALWDRLICIECKERFVDEPDKANDHEHDRDPFLKEKLRAEASGILAWLVRGHLAWQEYGLLPPDEVKLSTKDYKESQDTLGAFIADACQLDESAEVRASHLYETYVDWVGKKQAISIKVFGEYMKKRFAWDRRKTGITYFGVDVQSNAPAMAFGENPP